jgi:hypothetical protein
MIPTASGVGPSSLRRGLGSGLGAGGLWDGHGGGLRRGRVPGLLRNVVDIMLSNTICVIYVHG